MKLYRSFLFSLAVVTLAGCGPKGATTVYVTVPVTKPAVVIVKPKPTEKAKPVEPAKAVDPWEEARAYFKRVKEGEKEATEAKLKKMDKLSERFARQKIESNELHALLDAPLGGISTLGVELLGMGFTEYVYSRSAWAIDDDKFRKVFSKLNKNPNAEEIVNASARFAITERHLRERIVEVILSGGDTRDSPETHQAAAAWTGK